jgi:hypothetical protein
MDENADDPIKRIPPRELKMEPETEALLESPAMEPYVKLAVAIMQGKEVASETAEIAALPLERRYVWRVASALKWAFADLETLNVRADRDTLSLEDRSRLINLVKHRPLQFCLFLSALFGQKEMEHLMLSAIKQSRISRSSI